MESLCSEGNFFHVHQKSIIWILMESQGSEVFNIWQ